MKYEDFISKVQYRTGLGSEEDARVVTQATLITLGESLTGEEADDLASQLPAGIQEYLTEESPSDRAAGLSVEEFYRRVGQRAGLHLGEAEVRASAVASTLEEAVSGGEVQDVRALLPSELDSLFQK